MSKDTIAYRSNCRADSKKLVVVARSAKYCRGWGTQWSLVAIRLVPLPVWRRTREPHNVELTGGGSGRKIEKLPGFLVWVVLCRREGSQLR